MTEKVRSRNKLLDLGVVGSGLGDESKSKEVDKSRESHSPERAPTVSLLVDLRFRNPRPGGSSNRHSVDKRHRPQG